jgi:Ni/Co efflux regulator RcnB
MKKFVLCAVMAAVAVPSAPALAQTQAQRQYEREMRQYERDTARYETQQRSHRQAYRNWQQARNYDYNRYENGQNSYNADRYYRYDRSYQTRRLSANDRIYRGSNGQYYCRRNDGTTGLIVGGIAGALLGTAIAPGGSNTIGALIGGGAGALAGRAIERDNVRCR